MTVEVFRSCPADVALHPHANWVDIENGWEVSSLPVFDERELLAAALGRGPAMDWLASQGLEITAAEDQMLLHARSHFIEPQTLPDQAMLIRDGIPKPWQDEDGADTPWMSKYRSSNMMGIDWARVHDYRAWLALALSGWDGVMPVANFGKQWVLEGIFGWLKKLGLDPMNFASYIQPVSTFHDGDPTYDDYGTTFFAKRPARTGAVQVPRPEIPPPPDTVPSYPKISLGDSDGGDPNGPVTRFQRLLIGRGIDLPKYGADGGFGGETETAWTVAELDAGMLLSKEAGADVPPELWAWLEANQTSKLPGIDVSSNQQLSRFRWPELAATQRWIVGRATYGIRPDKIFDAVVERARFHGMAVGAYHFFRQQQDAEAQIQAFMKRLDALDFGEGDILPAIDLEDNERWDGKLNPTAHNDGGRRMVEAIADKYGACLIYTAPYHFVNIGAPDWLLEHHIWVADYGRGRKWPRWPEVTGMGLKNWAMWQTKPRRIEGYEGGPKHVIDVNVARQVPLIGGHQLVAG